MTRLITGLPAWLQRSLARRKAWLVSEPKEAFYWLLGHLRVRPWSPTLNQHMAMVTQRLGERGLARGFLSRAITLSVEPTELRRSYLELLIQEGRLEQALSTGLRWLRRSPDDRSLLMMVGYAVEKRWGYGASLPYYERAFSLGERAMFSHFLLMRATYQERGAEVAAPLASRHLASYPQDPDARAWVLCGQISEALTISRREDGLRAQSVEAYQRAVSRDPELREAHAALARCYESDDDELAYHHALRARGPQTAPELYLLLCRLELRRGAQDAARNALLLCERQAGEGLSEALSVELSALKTLLGVRDV